MLFRVVAGCVVFAGLLGAELLDLAPFARPCCVEDGFSRQTAFDYGLARTAARDSRGRWIYGLQWAEARDIAEVLVRFGAEHNGPVPALEYWSGVDAWQGSWTEANARTACGDQECRFALETPARTLKIRIVFSRESRPGIEAVRVFSGTAVKPVRLRVQLGIDLPKKQLSANPTFRAYNGTIHEMAQTRRGIELAVDRADPGAAGSNDVMVIRVNNGSESFSFAPADVERGPMYVPDFHAYISMASDSRPFSPSMVEYGNRIRERVAFEPEQTYARAKREIPPLDPAKVYLPLAADASWQKFAFEWGGHVSISKQGVRAADEERRRLSWPGDRISWRIGAGETPDFRLRAADSSLSILNDYLPVVSARWSSSPVEYEEEAFATLLSGPLAPEDPARSEQTPAVLLLRIRARNRGATAANAHLWIAVEGSEPVSFDGTLLTAGDSVRGCVRLPGSAPARLETCRNGGRELSALHIQAPVEPNWETDAYLAIPFIPQLSDEERRRLIELDYGTERARVVDYWRKVTDFAVPFHVPEPRFNSFAAAVIPHIRMAAIKDPKTGQYMAPAAAYGYKVRAGEAAFQAELLDVIGQRDLASNYLQPLMNLQGSQRPLGTFSGDASAVYSGARIDPGRDYTDGESGLDHGTVLRALAEHVLYTLDGEWLGKVLPSMKRAADWIIEQRRLTMVLDGGERCAEYGLLPAGRLERNPDWDNWFAVNAYASAGLNAFAEVLRSTNHAEAARYSSAAEAYREDLRAAVLRAASDAPVVRLRDNTYVPFVPPRPHQRLRGFGPSDLEAAAVREVLHGPLALLDTAIFEPNEPAAGWILDDWEDNVTMSSTLGVNVHGWVDDEHWFSRGGMAFQPNVRNPIRAYLRRGETRAVVRSLYNGFAACHFPSVNVLAEAFHEWGSPSGPFYKVSDEARFLHRLRDLLVMDFTNDLFLAPGAPQEWLATGKGILVRGAPSRFGPVTFLLRGHPDEARATVFLPPGARYRNAWIRVSPPEHGQLASVTVNGEPWRDYDRRTGQIRLPHSSEKLEIVVRFTPPIIDFVDDGRNPS